MGNPSSEKCRDHGQAFPDAADGVQSKVGQRRLPDWAGSRVVAQVVDLPGTIGTSVGGSVGKLSHDGLRNLFPGRSLARVDSRPPRLLTRPPKRGKVGQSGQQAATAE